MDIVEVGNPLVHFLFIATEQFATETEAVVQAECLAEVGQVFLLQNVTQENTLLLRSDGLWGGSDCSVTISVF